MNITTVGIDLAKIVFGVRGVDAHGKVARERDVSHGKLLECFANLPSRVVAWRSAAGFTIRSGRGAEVSRLVQQLGSRYFPRKRSSTQLGHLHGHRELRRQEQVGWAKRSVPTR